VCGQRSLEIGNRNWAYMGGGKSRSQTLYVKMKKTGARGWGQGSHLMGGVQNIFYI